MIKNIFFISALLIFLLSGKAAAAGKVSLLTVDGKQLVFATSEGKTSNSPACAGTETAQHWGVDLSTQAGVSSYNILLTAVANNLSVEVKTAGDCLLSSGIEQAQSVALSR